MLEVNQSQSKYWLYFLPFVNIRKQIIYCMLSHFLCFHTLTHDTVMRAFEHVKNLFNNNLSVGRKRTIKETFVHLYLIKLNILHDIERRVAGAEIVHGNKCSGIVEVFNHTVDSIVIVYVCFLCEKRLRTVCNLLSNKI